MKHLTLGLVLTVLVAGAATAIWGRGAMGPAGAFGLLATAIQLIAVRAVRPAMGGGVPFGTLVKRWAVGMGLRLAGVVILAVAIALGPEWFEPLPSAVGYLGVLIPLLFMETQFLK